MEQAGIDKCLIVSMPNATTNAFVASVVEKYPEKFKALGIIDFSKDLLVQVDQIMDMGLSGIKIHPRRQGINCTDPFWEPLFSYANEIGLPVMIDGYYQTVKDSVLLEELVPFRYDALAKTYRNIKFILSHMGAHRAFDAYFLAKSNPNVYLDNSHVLKYFQGTSLINDITWIMNRLDEKIIYGSDFPEYSLKEYYDTFASLMANQEKVKKVVKNITKVIEFDQN